MEPELIADFECVVGEGPLWHPDEQRLYWVDIERGRMFRYDPKSGHHEMCYEGHEVGGTTLQADGKLLLFGARGFVKTWDNGEMETIIDHLPDEEQSRFNDVIADPEGRVFCGTMPTPDRLGRLYQLETHGTILPLLHNIGCSNGMGFTADLHTMYYTDSEKREIYRFEYVRETGAITNQETLISIPEGEGVPDGMTVDAEGFIWSARWDGGCLVRYAPDGTEVRRIAFPAKKVSSVIFGGPDYTDMYVTTAGGDKKETDGPGAGALFRLRLGIRGVPDFRSRVGL